MGTEQWAVEYSNSDTGEDSEAPGYLQSL